jgi:hypothetical protein
MPVSSPMEDPTRTPPALRCLRGQPAPPDIVPDLAAVKSWPDLARQQLFRVLGPCLAEPVPDVEKQLDQFSREFRVPGPDLARVIKACRFLLRRAAMTNLTLAEFVEDLASLGDGGELSECLVPGYDAAMQVVRVEIATAALVEHGKLLDRVSWRVDQVAFSNRGDKVGLPVVMLTLDFHEGGKRERLTLQVTPAALNELSAMCARLVPRS